jgi:hypothetical protein
MRQGDSRMRGQWGRCGRQRVDADGPDPGVAEQAASLPGPSARAALPGLAWQAGQYRRLWRRGAGDRAGPGAGRRDRGDLRRGIADLINPTSSPPWLALKTLWFSLPRYQGPFVIRAHRLGRPGPVALGEGPTVAPLVVPPGPTLNGAGGWREAPGGLWMRAPGCYAWQVDGLTFSEIIVVRAVLH